MRLTDYTDYTLRTLIYLGLHTEDLVTIRQISEAYGISNNHLTKVVHQLGLSGMVLTVRGRGGGLRLAMKPSDICIGDVVRMTEPDFDMVECFDKARNDCVLAPACMLKDMLWQATQAWLAVLDKLTLEDVLANAKRLKRQVPRATVQLMMPRREKVNAG